MAGGAHVFISYRTEGRAVAERLFERLGRYQPFRNNIFFDRNTIRGGDVWAEVIGQHADDCRVMLVVIDGTWSTVTRNGRRALDDEDDWVRREVATALRRAIPVIPITIDGAELPEAGHLPAELAALPGHQGRALHSAMPETEIRAIARDVALQLGLNEWALSVEAVPQAFPDLIREQQDERKREMYAHFLPSAQGITEQSGNDWLFTGREDLIRRLVSWIGDRHTRCAVTFLTGSMGSGKSAVLGWIGIAAKNSIGPPMLNEHRSVILEEAERPRVNSLIDAANKDGESILAALRAAVGTDATETLGILAAADISCPGAVIVIDSLDEALPNSGVEKVMSDLAEHADPARIRVLIATRGNCDQFAAACQIIDLDLFPDTLTSIHRYISRLLARARMPANDDTGQREQIATRIAEAAGTSFIVAQHTVNYVAGLDQLPPVSDDAWWGGLPRSAEDAIAQDIRTRFPDRAQMIRDLLVPLAYAEGTGMPWGPIWPEIAKRASGRACGHQQVEAMLDLMGHNVVRTRIGADHVYRLRHQAYVSYIRKLTDPTTVHGIIADVLAGQNPPGAGTDWSRVNPYTRAHLATHAVAGGRPDLLAGYMTTAGYLLNADRPRLLRALSLADSEAAGLAGDQARRAVAAYRQASHQMRRRPEAEWAAFLDLAAREHGADTLTSGLSTNPDAWPAQWRATWIGWGTRNVSHLTYLPRAGTVTAIGTLSGQDGLAVFGHDDGRSLVWDLALDQEIAHRRGPPNVTHVDGFTVGGTRYVIVAAEGADSGWEHAERGVTLWSPDRDADTDVRLVNAGPRITDVTHAVIDGTPTVLVADNTGGLRLFGLDGAQRAGARLSKWPPNWITAMSVHESLSGPVLHAALHWDEIVTVDLTHGLLETSVRHLGRPLAAVCTATLAGRCVVIVADDSNRNTVWIADQDTPLTTPFLDGVVRSGGTRPNSIAVARSGRRLLAATASSSDGVPIWDVTSGEVLTAIGHDDGRFYFAVRAVQLDGRPMFMTASRGSEIRLWDVTHHAHSVSDSVSRVRPVRSLAFGTRQDRPILYAVRDQVEVWDLTAGTPDEVLSTSDAMPLPDHVLALDAGGNLLLAYQESIDRSVVIVHLIGDRTATRRLVHPQPATLAMAGFRSGSRQFLTTGCEDGLVGQQPFGS